MGSSESLLPPPPFRNRVTIFAGAGVVDEGWPGNDERGLVVRGVQVIKESFQKHLEKGVDTEAKIVPTGGVCDFLPPPPLKN